jgi:MSHA biogenesis protein MshQ
VSQASAGAATLSAATSTSTASANTCLNTATNAYSCSFTFANAGFVISVPNRDAGINNSDVTIQALKTGSTISTCVAAFPAGTRTVNLYSSYNNPGSGTKVVSVNNSALSTTSPGTSVTLTFDVNGLAMVPLSYPDVGQLTLNATGTALNGVAMSSTGGSFVVKPGGFVLTGIQQLASPNLANPGATSASGAKFVKAGELFSATVTATTCISGVVNCLVASAATPNFGKETIPESVTLTPALVTGLNLSAIPAIAYTSGLGTFSGGVATGTDFSWPEVGIITLTPGLKSGSYLGVASFTTTGTTSGNIGRFYPDHFNTAIVASASAPMPCGTGLSCPGNGMVYSGQPFSVNVTAMNLSDGVTTNYNAASGFANTVTLAPYSSLGGSTSLTGSGVLGVTSETSFASGAITEALEKFTLNTTPTPPTNIYIRATDVDGVSSQRAINPTATSIEGGIAVANGRIKVSNAYGSDLLPLSTTAVAQFYNASGRWLTSSTDNLTNLTLTSPLTVGAGPGQTTVTRSPASGLASGVLTINLSKPTSGAGTLTITPVVPVPGYLPVTSGVITFGIYKGNNSIIYMREIY